MRLLYVEWLDSCSATAGGVWKSGVLVRAAKPALVKSVGFVVARDKKRIVLAAHVGDDDADDMCGDMCIQRSAIKKVRRLKL